jgi:hypothetical protein
MMNSAIRDNFLETAPAKAAAAGDTFYATAANAIDNLTIGSANDALVVSGGIPAWSAANYIVRHTATAKVRIQSTRVAMNSGNPCSKDTKYNYAWTFPTAFSATPVVVGIIECSEATDPPTVESDIHTVGTTAATINAYFTSSGSPTPTLTAHLIAIGAIA